MTLHRLVYYSANRIETDSATFAAQIEQILEVSRKNNQLVGITGALMFSWGYFGQVLEGPQAAVEATFERIQQDLRHGDVSLLEFVPVSVRSFDTWAMAYVGEPSDVFASLANDTGFDAEKVSGERLFSKLLSMVQSAEIVA
jgi:hypothetical protein